MKTNGFFGGGDFEVSRTGTELELGALLTIVGGGRITSERNTREVETAIGGGLAHGTRELGSFYGGL